jgi:hypothetical protein
MTDGEKSAEIAGERTRDCPNCHHIVEESMDWICWECGWEIGKICWYCNFFNKGIDSTRCGHCDCPFKENEHGN